MKHTNSTSIPSKRRAIELYARDTPFRQRVVELKTRYRRTDKHRGRTVDFG